MMPETTTQYSLRLLERFAFYDHVKTNVFRDWPAGAVVTDPDEIKLLEERGAPVERIEMKPETDPKALTRGPRRKPPPRKTP